MLGAQEQVVRAFTVSAAPLVVTRISPQQIACWGERVFASGTGILSPTQCPSA